MSGSGAAFSSRESSRCLIGFLLFLINDRGLLLHDPRMQSSVRAHPARGVSRKQRTTLQFRRKTPGPQAGAGRPRRRRIPSEKSPPDPSRLRERTLVARFVFVLSRRTGSFRWPPRMYLRSTSGLEIDTAQCMWRFPPTRRLSSLRVLRALGGENPTAMTCESRPRGAGNRRHPLSRIRIDVCSQRAPKIAHTL